MTEIAVLFGVETLFSACCLWVGMKLTKVEGTFLAMLLIAVLSSLAGFIPGIGWIVGTILMYVLICKWTDAELWPDAILMVVVGKGVGILTVVALAAKMSS